MSGRHSVDDYPEHLNPFKKRLGLRGSFRELTRTLRRPFKKKNNPDIAAGEPKHIAAVGAANRNEQSEVALRNTDRIGTTRYNSELLPRSRFSERVALTKSLAPNPFESVEDKSNEVVDAGHRPHPDTDETASDGNTSLRRKYKRKKRAPLPPNNFGAGNLSVSDHNNSKWSINSCDTDCSSYTYHSETDQEVHEKPDLKGIQEISSEIQNYYQARDEEIDIKPTMPDIVVSVEAQTVEVDIEGDNVVEKSASIGDDDHTQIPNDSEDKVEILVPPENAIPETVLATTINEQEVKDAENGAVLESEVLEEIAQLEIVDEQNNNSTNENAELDINYVQTKSIYIASSRDDLDKFDYNERTSIYITGSRDALDEAAAGVDDCNNNNNNNNNNQEKPLPKIRKHKLTKMALLGSSENM